MNLYDLSGVIGTLTSGLIGMSLYPSLIRRIKKYKKVDIVTSSVAILPLFSAIVWSVNAWTTPGGCNRYLFISNVPAIINTIRLIVVLKRFGKKNLLHELGCDIRDMFKELLSF